MAEDALPRYFTVEEARALVPRLRGILTAIQAEKQQLDQEVLALQQLTPAMRSNGHGAEANRREERIAELVAALQEKVQQLMEQGIEVKDLNMGLVDFPSLRGGRVVYLCWRVDEPTVAFWHETDAGYAGRQPLEE